jgi:hypothetical protein
MDEGDAMSTQRPAEVAPVEQRPRPHGFGGPGDVG